MRTKFMIRWIRKEFFFQFLIMKVLQKNVWVVSLYTHFLGSLFFKKSVLVNDAFRSYHDPCPLQQQQTLLTNDESWWYHQLIHIIDVYFTHPKVIFVKPSKNNITNYAKSFACKILCQLMILSIDDLLHCTKCRNFT